MNLKDSTHCHTLLVRGHTAMSMENNPGIFIKSTNAFYQFPRTSIAMTHKLRNDNNFFFFFGTVLETRILKSRCWQSHGVGSGKDPSLPLSHKLPVVAGNLWCSLIFRCITHQFMPPCSHSFFPVCLSKITSHEENSHWISLDPHFNLTLI